ncbi:uncharacterized domain 1-containing protein [Gemmobacter megaterium]|uniref:Medium/long-chain acyl-CoA thioesterase YigI n=1 Tax=Gemmobacter megaterium TaxID=1086013 RepID=A0A1N7Q7F7_9RHOB|nr:PaaI family thioesterase [Gemmobacter megaterium]GGE23762.1 hypothetical protein GCM10011345_32130 [Gemmobacter megaterium]SIT18788.1 uncharacterized domain 1-containing protein [Gemmobacter megaterium]
MSLSPIQVSQGFNLMLGVQLLDWTAQGVTGQMRLRADMLNSAGIAHGGVYCSLLDFACGVAGCHAPEGEPRKFCVTLSLNTNFIASAVEGDLLTVRARRVGGGSRLFFAEAEIHNEDGALLAKGSGAFRHISPRNQDMRG